MREGNREQKKESGRHSGEDHPQRIHRAVQENILRDGRYRAEG